MWQVLYNRNQAPAEADKCGKLNYQVVVVFSGRRFLDRERIIGPLFAFDLVAKKTT